MSQLPLQDKSWNCGAACLMAVLRIHGFEPKIKEIESLAGTTEESGTSGEGIVKVLVIYGLVAEVLNTKKLSDIPLNDIRDPLIASVNKDRHWVVILTTFENNVVFFDPEMGTRVLPLKKFVKYWKSATGYLYTINGG